MSDEYILRTEGLTKQFHGFTAVDNVNLKIRTGSIHALIGPNGAGKTTCFSVLTKFLEPTAGRIFFKGTEITHMRPAAISRRGVVRSFQISAVFPKLTTRENVRIALQRRRGASFDFWRSKKVLNMLALLQNWWVAEGLKRKETTGRLGSLMFSRAQKRDTFWA